MIYLKRAIINEVVYTASEFGGTASVNYTIELENLQTLESNIYNIIDISVNPDRYNLSDIIVPEAIVDLTIDEDFIIGPTETIVAINDVNISTGASLTISGNLLIVNGIVNGNYTEITGSILEENMSLSGNQLISTNLPNVLILVDLLPGYYNYKILDSTGNIQYEKGKLLIENTGTSKTTYNPIIDTIVYNPNN